MESMTEKLSLIGLCACIYAVARLLHYWSLKLQDDPHSSVLSPILTFICIALWILSLPVTIVFSFLNKLHTDRLCELARKEGHQEGRRLAELEFRPQRKDAAQDRRRYEKRYNVTNVDGEQLCIYESDIPAFEAAQWRILKEREAQSANQPNL